MRQTNQTVSLELRDLQDQHTHLSDITDKLRQGLAKKNILMDTTGASLQQEACQTYLR
jgi:hypothetical protein